MTKRFSKPQSSGYGVCRYCKERIAWLLRNPKNIAVNVDSLTENDKFMMDRGEVWFRPGEHVPHARTCFGLKQKEDHNLFDQAPDYSKVYRGDEN